MLFITTEIKIAEHEFEFSYARSSGPGGQNVNKVNSKALLRWTPAHSGSLSDAVRSRFLARFATRLTTEGDIVITSDRHRDQIKNRDDCLEKLRQMILEVAHPPRPRRKTKPKRSSIEKRKRVKRHVGEKKRQRGRVKGED